jgi:hypothetical protein
MEKRNPVFNLIPDAHLGGAIQQLIDETKAEADAIQRQVEALTQAQQNYNIKAENLALLRKEQLYRICNRVSIPA